MCDGSIIQINDSFRKCFDFQAYEKQTKAKESESRVSERKEMKEEYRTECFVDKMKWSDSENRSHVLIACLSSLGAVQTMNGGESKTERTEKQQQKKIKLKINKTRTKLQEIGCENKLS